MARTGKKPYSLDFDIYYAKDRNVAVQQILDNLEQRSIEPTAAMLEQMGDYIMMGKDEKYMSGYDDKSLIMTHRRYSNYKTKDEKNDSLDALMEDPVTAPECELAAQTAKEAPRYKVIAPKIVRTEYDEQGRIIKKGDDFDVNGDPIPFMRELWERIDYWEDLLAQYKGTKEPSQWVLDHPKDSYWIQRVNHMLIDMRRQQYYIKDVYNPTIHFFNVSHGGRTEYNFNDNTGYWLDELEWCRRRRTTPAGRYQKTFQSARTNGEGQYFWEISENAIDYENPKHIYALMENYVKLLVHSYASPQSSTRALCFDFERFVDYADLTDEEIFILQAKIAHRNNFVIIDELREDGIVYSDSQFRHIQREVIPKKIANAAKRLRIESEAALGKIPYKRCSKCGEMKPADLMFFCKSVGKKSGFCSQCKECQKKKRDSAKMR